LTSSKSEALLPEGVAPTGSHRVRPATAAMIGILLLLGLATSVLRIAAPTRAQPSDVDLSVPDWRLAPDEIVALSKLADARRAAAPSEEAKEAKALLKAFAAFNVADIAHRGDRRSQAIKDAHAQYAQWSRTVVQFLGVEAFMGLGQRLSKDFVAALKRGDVDRVRELSGSYSVSMRTTGLTNDRGRPVSSQAWRIAELGFLTHWGQTILTLRPIEALLAPIERVALLRWKLASNPLLNAERREAVGHALKTLGSDYPTAHAIAARAANDGDWATAARFYRAAIERSPDDPSLRANAALADIRAAQ
jgi:hypothetical protein